MPRISLAAEGQGDQAREEKSKESSELTALLRSLSFGGTDERSEMSEKKECFRRFLSFVPNRLIAIN
jgi:hypothetical protein